MDPFRPVPAPAPAPDGAAASRPAPVPPQPPGPRQAAELRQPAEPRQRWRLVFRRRADAPPLAQRDQATAWEAALAGSGLPLVGLDVPVPRPRLVFAAPLVVGMAGERELVDLYFVEAWPVAEVRSRLASALPVGHEAVDLYDVWIGEPALSGRVVAADYRVQLADDGRAGPAVAAVTLAEAAERLLASPTIPRTRDKGGRSVAYDLRPLLADVEVIRGPEADALPVAVRIRTRFDPERGVGRPDEVVAALGGLIGAPLAVAALVRERLLLAGDDRRESRTGRST